MRTLFVYDSSMISGKVNLSIFGKGDTVYFFPLTSIMRGTTFISEKIKDAGCNIHVFQTAKIINSAADRLKDRYIKFIAELPEQVRYRDKNLKELFAIDRCATLWWFSLISEKNVYKSDAFNRLAQLDSIVSIIKDRNIDRIIFWCKSSKLEDALREYTLLNSIRFEALPIRRMYSFKQRFLKAQYIFYLEHTLFLVHAALQLFLRIWKIKTNINGLNRSVDFSKERLLLITPYPNIDILLARRGIFKNEFYPYLQEALENKGQQIIWVSMYVDNNSMSFRDSLRYARRFIENGYVIFFLEEFNSVSVQLSSLLTMFKNGLRYLKIEKDVSRMHSFGGYNFYPVFKDDWYSSFVGYTGYKGILYYKAFESLLRKVKASKCLYLCEMHAWEKALISAREIVGCAMPLYGYQSGTVSRMLLNYFNYPNELINDNLYPMPLPEKVICDGRLPYNYMRDSGWPEDRISIAEAIRYNHLNKRMTPKYDRKKNVVLLAFSISSEESSSILNIAYESLRDLNGIEVWMKAHPFLHLKKVLEMSGILERDICFRIKDEPIEELLSEARMVISGQSGVSVQALLYGCQVIIVNVPEWINMSPLKDEESRLITSISSPEELKQAVIKVFGEEYNFEQYAHEAREIIDEYFCLNQHSDIPDKFLTLLRDDGGKSTL